MRNNYNKMINKVILIGNLGKDPETRTLESGNTVTVFNLVTSENYRDKSGEWQQQTEWHKVVTWGKLAEKCAAFTKGQTVYAEGKLTTRQYEKDGQTRYITEVVANFARTIGKHERTESAAADPKPEEPEPVGIGGDDDLPF